MLLAYLDQNVLGYVRDGALPISARDDVVWVYSNEHFKEISRGADASFLSVLQNLRAREIEVVLDDQWQITDEACLHDYSCPLERYMDFIATVDRVPFDETLLTALIARLAGADNFSDVLTLTKRVQAQLERLLMFDGHSTLLTGSAKKTIDSALTQLIGHLREARSLEELRKPLGIDRGVVGNVKSSNPIPEIWDLIKEKCGDLTIGQFFGLETLDGKQRPKFLAIAACHTILNFIGYRTDKRIARPEDTSRILSDGVHIAHAGFCDILISEDSRTCSKAAAIYAYAALPISVVALKRK